VNRSAAQVNRSAAQKQKQKQQAAAARKLLTKTISLKRCL
jgi:hypothetical protein